MLLSEDGDNQGKHQLNLLIYSLFDFNNYKERKDVIFDGDDYSEQSPDIEFIETTGK